MSYNLKYIILIIYISGTYKSTKMYIMGTVIDEKYVNGYKVKRDEK